MKKITPKEFDKKFDNGEEFIEYLDFSKGIKIKDTKNQK